MVLRFKVQIVIFIHIIKTSVPDGTNFLLVSVPNVTDALLVRLPYGTDARGTGALLVSVPNVSKKYRYQAVKQKEQSKLKIKRQDYDMK